jgi:hypothetical protein
MHWVLVLLALLGSAACSKAGDACAVGQACGDGLVCARLASRDGKGVCATEAQANDDCKNSEGCATSGLCGFDPDLNTVPACRPALEQHCKESSGCTEAGLCHVVDGSCAAIDDDDCKRCTRCKSDDTCVWDDGRCVRFQDVLRELKGRSSSPRDTSR